MLTILNVRVRTFKNKHQFILLFSLLLISMNFSGQVRVPGLISVQVQKKVELLSGNPHPLKKLKHINIKYNFDSMLVCYFLNQKEFLEDIARNHRKEKAEKLINEWKESPEKLLKPKFEMFFNNEMAKVGIRASSGETHSNQATLIVTVLEEDPHFHREDWFYPPFVILNCNFVNEEGDSIVCFLVKATGSKERNMSNRRAECYAIAGKMLARRIVKYLI